MGLQGVGHTRGARNRTYIHLQEGHGPDPRGTEDAEHIDSLVLTREAVLAQKAQPGARSAARVDQTCPSLPTSAGELTTALSVTTHTWSRPARFALYSAPSAAASRSVI